MLMLLRYIPRQSSRIFSRQPLPRLHRLSVSAKPSIVSQRRNYASNAAPLSTTQLSESSSERPSNTTSQKILEARLSKMQFDWYSANLGSPGSEKEATFIMKDCEKYLNKQLQDWASATTSDSTFEGLTCAEETNSPTEVRLIYFPEIESEPPIAIITLRWPRGAAAPRLSGFEVRPSPPTEDLVLSPNRLSFNSARTQRKGKEAGGGEGKVKGGGE